MGNRDREHIAATLRGVSGSGIERLSMLSVRAGPELGMDDWRRRDQEKRVQRASFSTTLSGYFLLVLLTSSSHARRTCAGWEEEEEEEASFICP